MTVTQAPRLLADPRPVIVYEGGRHLLVGGRCVSCGHAMTRRLPRCTRCRAEVGEARFGPEGSVWAITVLHVAVGDRDLPDPLAYVDLDDGPRLLTHLSEYAALGTRVRLAKPTPAGDPAAEVLP